LRADVVGELLQPPLAVLGADRGSKMADAPRSESGDLVMDLLDAPPRCDEFVVLPAFLGERRTRQHQFGILGHVPASTRFVIPMAARLRRARSEAEGR
jgi:hypothetical protein